MAVGTIKDQIAIVGMGCVKFGENWEQSASDMMVDAAYEAFQDAGIESRISKQPGSALHRLDWVNL